MKSLINFLLLLVLLSTCKREDVPLQDIIKSLTLSSADVPANGISIITVTATINPDIDLTRRNVNFATTGGSFVDGKDGKISKVAEYQNKQLVAQVKLVAPSKASSVTVTAEMAYTEIKKDYIASAVLTATELKPALIELSADALSVLNNYDGEITITGKLLTISKGNASSGYNVKFSDTYSNSTPPQNVGGRFRSSDVQTSDGNSVVTVKYSPGAVPDQSVITIKAESTDPATPFTSGTIDIVVRKAN